MGYIITPVLGMQLADPLTIQAFITADVNADFLAIENGIVADRVRLTALESYSPVRAGASGVADFLVTTLAQLDAIANAVIGDTVYMTDPGSGNAGTGTIGGLLWRSVSGAGVTMKWTLATTVVAVTQANFDAFIAAVVALTDLSFRISELAYVSGTPAWYRIISVAGGYIIAAPQITQAVIPNAAVAGGATLNTVVIPSLPCASIIDIEVDATFGNSSASNGSAGVDFTNTAGALTRYFVAGNNNPYITTGLWESFPRSASLALPANTAATVTMTVVTTIAGTAVLPSGRLKTTRR